MPVLAGAGSVGRILLGVLLIGLAFIPGVGASLAAATYGSLTSVGTVLLGLGASLVLGGVAQLLSPVPQVNKTMGNDPDDPRRSFSFSGIQQTSRQGIPVPICYGEMLVGSVVISAGIDTVQVAV